MTHHIITAEKRAKVRERIVLLARMANINHGEEEALAILNKLPEVEKVAWKMKGVPAYHQGGTSDDVDRWMPLYAIKEQQ